jgi:leucine dehydrogenase
MVNLVSAGAPHEAVHFVRDDESGLQAVIAIHSTVLGPAAGGCRLWSYDSREEAVQDALRLSEGMCYKNALAGLPLGGGKAVIMRPTGHFDRRALFQAFGRAVERLEGRYVTAEDVGTTLDDMIAVGEATSFVAGRPKSGESAGGDPSPWTALGVFESLRTCVAHRLQRPLADIVVAVQGLGNVGIALVGMLHEAGAWLIVSDVSEERVEMARERFGATPIAPEAIAAVSADVFAPCALGGAVDETVARSTVASVICGAANNQLATEGVGRILADRGVLYAPDFLVNAGGIINVAAEYLGKPSADVETQIRVIPERMEALIAQAERTRRPTGELAEEMARDIIAAAAREACVPAE